MRAQALIKDNSKGLTVKSYPIAAKPVSAKAGFDIRQLNTLEEIEAISDEWRRLEALCPDTVLFQSYDWCCNFHVFAEETRTGEGRFRPIVVIIRKNGTLVGLMPMALQTKRKMKLLTGFTEPFQQYTEILLDPSVEVAGLRNAFVAELKKTGADYLHFGQVRQDGKLAELLEGIARPSGELDAAPFVAISDFYDHETYLKTIRSKTRKNLRNARNRLERDAELVHHVGRDGDLMREVVARVYEGREAWLERLGITSRAFRDENFEAFLKRFSDDDKAKGVETLAMSLKHGGVPVSDQWGFVFRGRYYAFMATWNPLYEAASPGRLHLGEVIKTCFDEGLATADFLMPASSYKMTWTDQAVPVTDYVLATSLRGKLYCGLWLDLVRPLAKRIFFKFPAGIRGSIMKMFLRVAG